MGNIFSDNAPGIRKRGKEGCTNSDKTTLQSAERIFQPKLAIDQQSYNDKTRNKAFNEHFEQEAESSGMCSIKDVKCLLQNAEINVYSADWFEQENFWKLA